MHMHMGFYKKQYKVHDFVIILIYAARRNVTIFFHPLTIVRRGGSEQRVARKERPERHTQAKVPAERKIRARDEERSW